MTLQAQLGTVDAELLAEFLAITEGIASWAAVIADLETVGVEGATVARWFGAFADKRGVGIRRLKSLGLHHDVAGWD